MAGALDRALEREVEVVECLHLGKAGRLRPFALRGFDPFELPRAKPLTGQALIVALVGSRFRVRV